MRTAHAAPDGARWVDLAEVDNMRDLGGLPVAGGGTVRRGVLYRASTLQEATPADVEVLVDGIGLRTVIDLRGPHESSAEGHGLLEAAAVQRLNLPVRRARGTHQDAVPDVTGRLLTDFYLAMLDGSGRALADIARIVADEEQHAVVFHCAVGKDRTGLVAAVLLDAVGVPADAISADYALTATRIERLRARLVRLASYRELPAVDHGIMGADTEAMDAFLAVLHQEFGGGADWLAAHGLTDRELAALSAALVAPAGS